MALRVIQTGQAKDVTGDEKAKGSRWSGPVVVLVVLLAVLVIAVGATVVIVSMRPEPAPAPTGTGAPPSASPTPTADEFRDKLAAWQQENSDTVVEEIVPGLNRCASSVEHVNSSSYTTIDGQRWGTGFPQDIQGAVAASGEALRYMLSKEWWLEDQTMMDYWFLDGANKATPEDRQSWRGRAGVDDQGRVLDSNGVPMEDAELRVAGYPRYGLYRVDLVDRDPGSASASPKSVTVTWVMPQASWVYGTGRDPAAYVYEFAMAMTWQSGDWHVKWRSHGTGMPGDGSAYVNPGWDALATWATNLDGAWCVPSDGTQDSVPGYWATRP